MKITLRALLVVLLLTSVSFTGWAQCKGFAKKICKLELDPYIHDGNYHANILTEGEEAELYKTFYSGQEYRIAICGSDDLPAVQFKIIDNNRRILYDNADHDYAMTWDFKLEASQQLKIAIKVVPSEESTGMAPQSGCVSIMFGFMDK
ncbi:MAG: hypothetical protein JXB49_27320 [Bacteroidales bacterium]|nr:hypothetical protein [Bacteroidales bacterium]